MSNFSLFRPLFDKLDTLTAVYVTDMSANATAAIGSVVVPMLTLGFLAFGMLIIRGAVQAPAAEFIAKSTRSAIIIGIALTGGFYQGQIASAIRTTPDALASALVPNNSGSGSKAADLIDEAAGKGFQRAGEAWDKAHAFSLDAFFYVIIGLIVMVATVAIVAVGGAFILLAKVALAIAAGLGPIFITCLLWQKTERFFDAWAGVVCGFGLLVVLTAASFGLMLNIFTGFVDTVQIDESQNVAMNMGGLLILAVAMVLVLLQLPGTAATLGGGIAVAGLHELRSVIGAGKSAGKAGGEAGSASMAGGKGVIAGIAAARGGAGLGGSLAASGKAVAGHYKDRRMRRAGRA